jgi:2-polyprenyl-3-methyl-5-hydroxy-6-metoxy-1,4-benzoquinol methylase
LPVNLPPDATLFPVRFKGDDFAFYRPRDTEALLNEICDEKFKRDEFLPYWAEFWPSAAVFLKFLPSLPLAPHSRVCELGCGLGVISALLSHRGINCIATDYSQQACHYALTNIAQYSQTPQAVCFDWRAPAFKRGFETLIGSDILYEARWIEPVLSLIKTLLAPQGVAYIADPQRSHWQLFNQTAQAYGLKSHVAFSDTTNGGKTEVQILALQNP